jgi:hypothetical protein
MSKAAISLLVFGIYLIGTAAILIFAPNVLLGLLGFAPAQEPWIRVCGVVMIAIAIYYLAAARAEDRVLFRASTWGRWAIFAGFLLLVVMKLAEPKVIIFGAVDALGAVWTFFALKGGSIRGSAQSPTTVRP